MISERAKGVVRVVKVWERVHQGEGVRDAYTSTMREARELRAQLCAKEGAR